MHCREFDLRVLHNSGLGIFNSFMKRIGQVKPVVFWILVVAIAYQVANTLLIHFVVFPSGISYPLVIERLFF